MKNCLMIMSFRDSDFVRNNQLQIENIIDVCYLRCFKEYQLYKAIEIFIDRTEYDNYFLASDDMIMTEEAIKIIERGLEKYEVVTGYSNLIDCEGEPEEIENKLKTNRDFRDQYNKWGPYSININNKPPTLKCINNDYTKLDDYFPKVTPAPFGPTINDYNFISRLDIDKVFPEKDDENFFQVMTTGLTYFGMRRYLWKKYPLYAYRARYKNTAGGASDHLMSIRLFRDNIKMMSHKLAFSYHLKYNKNFNNVKRMPEWDSGNPSIILKKKGENETILVSTSDWKILIKNDPNYEYLNTI